MIDLRPVDAFRVTCRDKWLIAASVLLMWHARIELRLIGFRHHAPARLGSPAPPKLIFRITRSFKLGLYATATPSCLVQAMAGKRLLAMKGYSSEIRVGVRKGGTTGFEAHAWLVSGQHIVLGGTEEALARYAPLIESA